MHICYRLLHIRDESWLLHQRSQYVSQEGTPYNSSRVSAAGGRTGTRLNIGRPQTRWHEGVALAEAINSSNSESSWSGNALCVSTVIKSA